VEIVEVVEVEPPEKRHGICPPIDRAAQIGGFVQKTEMPL
jgi:hypothetical protein